MTNLVVCAWIWGDRFDNQHIVKLFNGIDRQLKQPHRNVCFVDRRRSFRSGIEQYLIPDPELMNSGACARLRLFDPEFQASLGFDGRIVCMDIDCVITGPLDALFDRDEPFVCTQHINTVNPCTLCPCLTMLRAGYRGDVWREFSIENWNVPTQSIPSDESWIWHKLPGAAAWMASDGVYVYGKKQWPGGDELPADARIVFFQHKRDQRKLMHLDWVAKNWTL